MTGGQEERIVPVIMCGGAGTRLWPVSREAMPKQFVPLVGERSTFQQVLARVGDRTLFAPPLVVTSADFRFVVAEQARACGAEIEIVLEPVRRDSGPAIAVASEIVASRCPTGLMLVVAADHVIGRPDAFMAACLAAREVAQRGRIVTFGVPPTEPATSYGYIRPGAPLNGSAEGGRAVLAFVEKPDASTAARYVADGYFWNSGNFLFRADVMLAEIGRLEPGMAEAARAAVEGASRDLDFLRLAEEPFSRAPKKSIDYAVMEHTTLAAVLPLDCAWSDIGSWSAVWEAQPRDSDGNVTTGPVELLGTRGSLVHTEEGLLTAVVGCTDLIVVATPDAVLVVPRDDAEQVKPLVEQLKGRNRSEAVAHRRTYRPWGYYQGIDVGERYLVKRIVVKPGAKLSLQKHFHRAEHWIVVRGTAEVAVGDETRMVHENESIYVPIGRPHRLANPGRIPLELIEVQVGSYLGEDDIVRIEDVYRRE
jgi:mannose-1-phosphate guanylyltransferase/mannose-6-phosphate isomerase